MQVNTSSDRLKRLREKIIEKNLDALLVSKAANRFYLTGWLGDSESGYILVTGKKAFVITDSRYTEEVTRRVVGFELREYGQDDNFWPNLFKETKTSRVGFEADDFSIAELRKFRKATKAHFYPCSDLVENLRSSKDPTEIKLIKKAVGIADKSFEFLLANVKSGMSEREVAWEMEKFMRGQGSSKNAWDPFIVASGPNSSMVHYGAGERKLKKGDTVLLDWGCYFQGYCCDISRVVFLGTPTNEQAEIYNLVLDAQQKALEQIKVGARTKKADLVARDFLKEKTDYYFRHAVGHGVGIEVHELPKINEKAKGKFEEGNVVTVEPGIYIPGWGGVRIEDMVFVSAKGPVPITKSPKKLAEVVAK